MTPQLQQAIRLLQLSAADLSQEIQDALDSNLMLETEEEGELRDRRERDDRLEQADALLDEEPPRRNGEAEIDPEATALSDELPVDSDWSDIYDGYVPPRGAGDEDFADTDYLMQRGSRQTLRDFLRWQINLAHLTPADEAIADAIVDAVGEDGYLTCSLADIQSALEDQSLSLDEVEAVLHRVQALEPAGVAARTPQECLLIQLRQLPDDTPLRERAIAVCRDHFGLLTAKDHNQLKRRASLTDSELERIGELIRSLHPRPGSLVSESEPEYIIPDVVVYKSGGQWRVELNPDAVPRLRVNPDYARLIRRADQSQDNTCLKNHLNEARWLIKSIASRNETVVRVASKIVDLQRAFFEHGEEAMRPLVLKDVATALDLHESTVSRVTSQKYMHTPRGTFEFKYFFSSHLSTAEGGECSSTAIRAVIRKIIAAEPARKPLSDNRISSILGAQGIEVARRTVAKYREAMGIPPSNERKRLL